MTLPPLLCALVVMKSHQTKSPRRLIPSLCDLTGPFPYVPDPEPSSPSLHWALSPAGLSGSGLSPRHHPQACCVDGTQQHPEDWRAESSSIPHMAVISESLRQCCLLGPRELIGQLWNHGSWLSLV